MRFAVSREIALTAAAIAVGTVLCLAEQPAGVRGIVKDDLGAPVAQALVGLQGGPQSTTANVSTDDDGLFLFSNVVPGVYTLVASSPTHPSSTFGSYAGVVRGIEIMVGNAGLADRLALQLPRGGVVAGSVQLPTGDPAPLAEVAVFSGDNGSDREPFLATTDNEGRYRIFGVPAGSYLVAARPERSTTVGENDAVRSVVAPTLFGDTTDWRAAPSVSIAPGTTASAPIRLQLFATGIVTASIKPSSPTKPKSYRTQAIPETAAPTWWTVAWSREELNDETGIFAFENLMAGPYRFITRRLGSVISADDPDAVAVSRGVAAPDHASSVEVQLRRALAFSGTVVCGAASGRVTQPREVTARGTGAIAAISSTSPVSASGAFQFHGLLPGIYRMTTGTGARSVERVLDIRVGTAVTAGGRFTLGDSDISGAAVRCFDQAGSLSGAVLQADGKPLTDVLLIALQKTQPATARVVRPDTQGRYSVVDLAPGDYSVGVGFQSEYFRDPGAVLESIGAAGVAITIGDGERRTLDLRANAFATPLVPKGDKGLVPVVLRAKEGAFKNLVKDDAS